ncbi:hypothetical protein ACFLWY_04445 [Chloroflexota bacterium]
MNETIGVVISVIAALGIGGIAGAFVQAFLQQRRYVRTREQNFKQTRYLAILILMLTQLDLKTGLGKTRQFRNDLNNLDDVKKEIETEFLHSFVFADDAVIYSLSEFIKNPNRGSFIRVAVAMRRDLWGKKTQVTENVLEAFDKGNVEQHSSSNKDDNKIEDSKINGLLKYIAEGGLYGGLLAVLGISIASFYAGWIGMSVTMLLFGIILFVLGSKKLDGIIGEAGVKTKIPWATMVLSLGVMLLAVGMMGLVDSISSQIPRPTPDSNWVVEGGVGLVLTVVGLTWLKVKKREKL